MIYVAAAVAPIFLFLVVSEYLWRAKILRGEPARKLLHIIIGSYVAVWPFFLTIRQIELLAVALFVGVAISHKLKIFHAILDIRRKTCGDLLYAVGIGVTALLAQSPWIFAAAILHMSVADGLAGLLGTIHGKRSRYLVWGQDKSLVGSAAFMACSMLVLYAIVPSYLHIDLGILLLLLPFTATLTENIGVYGTDNVLVPLMITVALNAIY